MIRKGLSDRVTAEQRLEWSEGTIICGGGKHFCLRNSSKTGTCLRCLRHRKEARRSADGKGEGGGDLGWRCDGEHGGER